MIKLIILTSLCALAIGQADPPPPPDDVPQLTRIARQTPQMSDMGQAMGSAGQQYGNFGQGQMDTIDPLGLIKKGQNIAKEMLTGRKRRETFNPDQVPPPPPPPQFA